MVQKPKSRQNVDQFTFFALQRSNLYHAQHRDGMAAQIPMRNLDRLPSFFQ